MNQAEVFGQTATGAIVEVSRVRSLILLLMALCLSACNASNEKPRVEADPITVTTLQPRTVTLTQKYVCQIESHHHIKIRAVESGYVEAIKVKSGQKVKQDDLLFQVNFKKLLDSDAVVSKRDASPIASNLDKAKANMALAAVTSGVGAVKAPFDGIINRLECEEGGLVQKGATLATLSDNSQMCAYFNVPEAVYLEYKANLDQHRNDLKIELQLSNGSKYGQIGKLGAIGSNFDVDTGNIKFRADFSNPDGRLRHGQAGTVLINRVQNDAIVIPQQATFELNQKRYVYVVDQHDVAHQREVVIENELDGVFVVKTGVSAGEKIVVERGRVVRDGEKIEYQVRQPKEVFASLK
jgi:membrane fusion protein (multidrug efflux system)